MLNRFGCLVLALSLSGCVDIIMDTDWLVPNNEQVYPPYEGMGFTDRAPTEREQLISKSDFSVELVRFEDARRPRSTGITARDTIVYDYDPDTLLQSVTYKMPVLITKHLSYKPKLPKNYLAEVDLTTLHARIVTGDVFSGKMGRYTVHLEADVLVRRPDSFVAINKPYAIDRIGKRQTFNGRPPSEEMDRARQYDLVEDAIRSLAERIAWDLRQNDVRRWNVDKTVKPSVNIRPTHPKLVKPEASTAPVMDEPTTLEQLITPASNP
jgi:hypothetical protein